MQVLLIRHAQSENNAAPIERRTCDPSLTALGRDQAERLALLLDHERLTHLFVSPFRRTLETATPLLRRTAPRPRIWVPLHEHGGCFDGYDRATFTPRNGLSARGIRDRFPEFASAFDGLGDRTAGRGPLGDEELGDDIAEPGWWTQNDHESIESASARAEIVRDRLARLSRLEPEARVALMSHGTFAWILVRALLEIPISDPPRLGRNTGIARLEIDRPEDVLPGEPIARLESWNELGHLPLDARSAVGGRIHDLETTG